MAIDFLPAVRSVVPAALAEHLALPPIIHVGEPIVDWKATDGDGVCAIDPQTGLQLHTAIDCDVAHRAAVVRVSLRNGGDERIGPIGYPHPAIIDVGPATDAVFRHFGGGGAFGGYPTPAFAPHDVYTLARGEPIILGTDDDGRSSNAHMPIVMLAAHGGGVAVGLAWSGPWTIELNTGHAVQIRPRMNCDGKDLWVEPGETLELPALHLVFFEGDLDAGGNALRRYIHEAVMPRTDDGSLVIPPVVYDHWFGIHCQFDETLLRAQADRAAQVGAEYFVLDGCWPAGGGTGGDFAPSVGNWLRPDPVKLPGGIEPLADYVRELGMKFGLWLDIERAHRTSDVLRDHPDWFLDIGRADLHPDLTNDDAVAGLADIACSLFERYDVRFVRWDYNIWPRPYWDRLDATGKMAIGLQRGFERLLETVRTRCPQVLIEHTASGGRRMDLSVLASAHMCWFSDQVNSGHVCRLMQTHANRFLPGCLLNSCLAVQRGNPGVPGALTPARVLGHMAGTFLLSGDIAAWPDEDAALVKRLVALYKTYRHLLVADFYALTPPPRHLDDVDAVSFVARDGSDAVVLAYAVSAPPRDVTVQMRELKPGASYAVRDELTGKTATHDSDALMREGLRVNLAADGAAVYRVTKR